MKEDARKMVLTMVDMERSYLTADVFRDIISQNGAADGADQPGMLRTLSGRPTAAAHLVGSILQFHQCNETMCLHSLVWACRVLQLLKDHAHLAIPQPDVHNQVTHVKSLSHLIEAGGQGSSA